ncbi:MAG: nucleotide exchange factor GrpE [Candidatus Lokiarchaeota archaeon]|nr:nucleotide exchange factor GrpE [Candidatus Lokiarchaeota archaeon]
MMNKQKQEKSDKPEEKDIVDSQNEKTSESEVELKDKKNEMEEESKEEEKFKDLSREELIEKIIELEDKLKNQEDKIKELQKSNKDWKDKFMRLQAEFENTQKRWEKSRKNLRIQYTANTLKNFLSLYDSFKSAVENEDTDEHIEQFYKQFMNIMKSMGAHPMHTEELQKFDYNKHEALSSLERDDLPNNTIVDVIQDGWIYEKEVIRYAKVIISRKPKPPEQEKEEKEKDEDQDKDLEKEQSGKEKVEEKNSNEPKS